MDGRAQFDVALGLRLVEPRAETVVSGRREAGGVAEPSDVARPVLAAMALDLSDDQESLRVRSRRAKTFLETRSRP